MTSLPVGAILMGLFGGLALFLYGMELLTSALKRVAGARMTKLLSSLTTNRLRGVLAGTFVTATIQSSSVTTVLVIGFISAGLLSLAQSIPIIMGASIGTTITAQIVAFKVTQYSLLLVAVGFGMWTLARKEFLKQWGTTLMSLGLIFFGMELMKDATAPLRDYPPFIDAMKNLDNPLLAIAFGALFTALVQSSSATTGIIIVLASEGLISLDAGIPLVLGANIGTCITAALAAMGKPREAARAALVHVLFNTAGVVVWFFFIPWLADLVVWLSPVSEGLEGVARMQADTPRQIANAHTIFNVSTTLLFIGFTPAIARLVEALLPDRRLGEELPSSSSYLDDLLVHTPSMALDLVRMELGRLGAAAHAMVLAAPEPVLGGTSADLDDLRAMDAEVDAQHGALVTYLGRLSMENLSEAQSHRLSEYLSTANHFESIGDLIETNLVDEGRARLEENLQFSPKTREVLARLHGLVEATVRKATEAVAADDKLAAQEILDAKAEIQELADEAEDQLARRLVASDPNRLGVYRVESEFIEAMKRIYYHAKRVAKLVVDEAATYAPQGDAPVDPSVDRTPSPVA